jgi:hypothetical protein
MDQARRALYPVAPEWMSGLIEAPERGGIKINWWASLTGCMQESGGAAGAVEMRRCQGAWTGYSPQAENASPNACSPETPFSIARMARRWVA